HPQPEEQRIRHQSLVGQALSDRGSRLALLYLKGDEVALGGCTARRRRGEARRRGGRLVAGWGSRRCRRLPGRRRRAATGTTGRADGGLEAIMEGVGSENADAS